MRKCVTSKELTNIRETVAVFITPKYSLHKQLHKVFSSPYVEETLN